MTLGGDACFLRGDACFTVISTYLLLLNSRFGFTVFSLMLIIRLGFANPIHFGISGFFKILKVKSGYLDSVYLTCSKKLTGNQLSPPHGINKKIKM